MYLRIAENGLTHQTTEIIKIWPWSFYNGTPSPLPPQTRTPKGLSPFGATAGSVLQGRLERHLGIQAGGVAGVACAGGEGVVGPD